MRLFCAFVLVALLGLLPLASGGNRAEAFVQLTRPSSVYKPGRMLEVAFVCGMFDGKFTCKSDPGAGAQYGKNVTPGARIGAPENSSEDISGTEQGTTPPAPGTWSTEATPSGTPDAAGSACQHGMIGAAPTCRCPPSSELLGGNCVRYTASACSNGLAADALPQACPGIEEKLSCKLREDGLKDCCCVTYDKF